MKSSTARRWGIGLIFAAVLLYWAFPEYAFFPALLLVLAGAVFLFAAIELHVFGQWPRIDGAWQLGQPLPEISQRERRPTRRKRISQLPNFGLFAFSFFVPMVFLFLLQPRPHIGLMVRVVKDRSVINANPASEPAVIRVDEYDRYFLNGNPVALKDLRNALEEALRLHFSRVVLVEGEPDASYQAVVSAVDAIRGARAQAILISRPGK